MNGGHDGRGFAVSRQCEWHYVEDGIPVCVLRTMAGLKIDHRNERGTEVDLKADIDKMGRRTNPKVVSHGPAYKIEPEKQHRTCSGMSSGMCSDREVDMAAVGGSNIC